jgi:nitroimidazol reductase NimA-like FMN-containing flavoprotein (pyridoxamine 5'-phosphate oxidase superfamily)
MTPNQDSNCQGEDSRHIVQRGSKRAAYDTDTLHAILDAGQLCHVGFVCAGEARVIPTAYARWENSLVFHGHLRNNMLNALLDGQMACVTVTLLDGMVLARSAFHHSMNYRSAVVFGCAELVAEEAKQAALDVLMEHLTPGRLPLLRPYTRLELAATCVVRLPIHAASAKVRTGPPIDEEADYELPIWAGVVPLQTHWGKPQNCPRVLSGVKVPESVIAMSV